MAGFCSNSMAAGWLWTFFPALVGAISVYYVVGICFKSKDWSFRKNSIWKDKPQKKFRRILADNSTSPFVHAHSSGPEDLHPYADQIRALVDAPVLHPSNLISSYNRPPSLEQPYIWVDSKEKLVSLAAELANQKEFGVDTEQHIVHSFLGFTALIQISTHNHDYLIDAIALHDVIGILRPVFANPSIRKVFHGADNDILWLQRDYHVYVVNLFDTARACDVLSKPQRSLAYLLQTYCNISTDKTFQKADWRQRPLPDDMTHYARVDAHYLLYIADRLYHELIGGGGIRDTPAQSTDLLEQAVRRSHMLCLQLYEKDGSSSPMAAASSLLTRFYSCEGSFESEIQDKRFRKLVCMLCRWRDNVARKEDESLQFVLSDATLLGLAKVCPLDYESILVTVSETQEINGIMQSFLLDHIGSLLKVLKQASDDVANSLDDGGDVLSESPVSVSKIDPRKKVHQRWKSPGLDYSRLRFVKKFSCKGPVYQNCRIYAGDGRLLCYCDRKKIEWYLERGLAEALDEDPPSIKLLFEPRGRPEDKNNEFYIQSKENRCVSCGESNHYLRYRIIPSCYRQYFPEHLKSHRSHDIVLLCVDCHEIAHQAAEKHKRKVAAEFSIPLFAKSVRDAGKDEAEYVVVEGSVGVSPLQLRMSAMALLCHGSDLPAHRREELTSVVKTYYGGREIDNEDLKAALMVGIDSHGEKRLNKKFRKIISNQEQKERIRLCAKSVPQDGSELCAKLVPQDGSELCDSLENGNSSSISIGKSRTSLLGHGPHGKRVVERLMETGGEDAIRLFIQGWRSVFVDSLKPAFLPPGWDIAHSGHREFGDYSVYNPHNKTHGL